MDNQTNKPLYIITGATAAMGSVVTQNLAEAGHAAHSVGGASDDVERFVSLFVHI